MKALAKLHLIALLCVFAVALGQAQGTAFTYQGRLNQDGSPATGIYDLRFAIYDSAGGATIVAGPVAQNSVGITNGLFTTVLNFGAGVFTGPGRWLEIAVRTNGGPTFSNLTPRQALTATPYAITASNLSGSVSANQLSGTIPSNNIGAGSITTVMLAEGAVGSNQLASGSVTTPALAEGAVTADKMATVSNWFALTIPNPTPADSDNFGAAVAGLGSDRLIIGADGDDTGAANAGAAYLFNTRGQRLTTFDNPTPAANEQFGISVATVGSDRVLVGAPGDGTGAASAGAAYLFRTNGTLLMTFTNPTPAAFDSFGYALAALGEDRLLIGAYADDTGAANGGAAYLFSTNGTLIHTFTNPAPAVFDHFGGAIAAVGNDRVLITAVQDDIGAMNAGAAYLFSTNGALLVTVTNPIPASSAQFGVSAAAFGSDRVLIGTASAGRAHLFSTSGTLLATFVHPDGDFGTFFGYSVATVDNDRVLIGSPFNGSGTAFLFSTNGTLLARFAHPAPSSSDEFSFSLASVGGNRLLIGANRDNTGAQSSGAAYLLSMESFTDGLVSDAVRAGSITTASIEDGSVTAAKLAPTIGVWTQSGDNVYRTAGNVGIGTTTPVAKLEIAAAAGDLHQRITDAATGNSLVLQAGGGSNMKVTGYNYNTGTGVPLYLSVDGANTILNVSGGNVGIGTTSPANKLHVAGGVSATAFVNTSDRNAKENFMPVSPQEVLNKVMSLPITTWNFKELKDGRHMGPMAQDFHATFGLGDKNTTITSIDPDGVALAAIQGLNQKLENELKRRDAENAELRDRMAALEELIKSLSKRMSGGER